MEKKETEICQSFEDNCMISTSHKTNALRLPIHIIFNILQYNYPKEKLYQCRIICKAIKNFVINLIKESVKDNQNIEEHYRKFQLIYEPEVNQYFYKKIFYLIQDAEGIYELVNKFYEKTYNGYYELCLMKYYQVFPQAKQTSSFKKEFRFNIEKKILTYMKNVLTVNQMAQLYFDGLETYKEGIKILKFLINQVDCLRYLNLSGSIIEEKDLITIIDATELKNTDFVLEIKDMTLSKQVIKIIKEIQRKFPNKSYVIDNFYNGVKKNLEIRKNRVKNKTNKDFNFWKDDDIDVIY